MLQNRWLGLLLVVLLAATAACGGSGDQDSKPEAATDGASSGPADVPDVVAEVNGEAIPKQDFVEAYKAQSRQQAAQQSQTGQQPDEKKLRDQVVQSLVNQELLTQEADRREITPSDQQVHQTLADLAAQNGLKSADAFVAALEKQGLDRKEIDSQAIQQTQFDMLVADETGPVQATGKQVRTLYEQLKAQQAGAGKGGQKVPPLSKVRSQLEDQIESQQESQATQKLIGRLRKDADINLNV